MAIRAIAGGTKTCNPRALLAELSFHARRETSVTGAVHKNKHTAGEEGVRTGIVTHFDIFIESSSSRRKERGEITQGLGNVEFVPRRDFHRHRRAKPVHLEPLRSAGFRDDPWSVQRAPNRRWTAWCSSVRPRRTSMEPSGQCGKAVT